MGSAAAQFVVIGITLQLQGHPGLDHSDVAPKQVGITVAGKAVQQSGTHKFFVRQLVEFAGSRVGLGEHEIDDQPSAVAHRSEHDVRIEESVQHPSGLGWGRRTGCVQLRPRHALRVTTWRHAGTGYRQSGASSSDVMRTAVRATGSPPHDSGVAGRTSECTAVTFQARPSV